MSFAILEFKTTYKKKTDADGNERDVAVDHVLIAPRGEGFDRVQTWHRVSTLIPREGDSGEMATIMRARWAQIEPAYQAYKEGNDIPIDGTPLGAWPGVNADQAKYLRGMGIHTIEAVAEMSDGDVNKLPFPGRIELPKLARDFLDGKDKAAMAEEKSELLARIAAMEEMLADKPKRGRPKKSEAA